MIDWFYKKYGFDKKSRTYWRITHQDYFELAKYIEPKSIDLKADIGTT